MGYLQAGVQALNEVRRMKRDQEIKEISVNTTLVTPLAGTWVTQYLNDIDQGNTAATREGNKIVIKSIRSRMVVVYGGAETDTNGVRIAIVYDRKPEGNLATGAMIFDENTIRGNINSADARYSGRFQILHDEIYPIDYNNSAVGSTHPQTIDPIFIRRSMKTEYNATGGGINDCQKGAILLCSVGLSLTANAELHHNTKFKYADS